MLVLTRKRDESIMIGDEIEVKVLEIRENQVKLGVKAPRTTTVHRREIYLAIQKENIEAAAAAQAAVNIENILPPSPASEKKQR